MFFVFLFHVRSATSSDLLPPYYLSSNNISGSWQFGGGTIIQEDYVVLLPPIQFYKGCAWSIVPPPSSDWSIYFHLNISVETGGGGFCIWLIESHGADGPFYGGPKQFKGIGIIGSISEPNVLKLKLIESYGNETFSTLDSKSDNFDFVYHIINESVILCLAIFSDSQNESIKNVNVSFLNDEFVSSQAISRRINISISNCWLGITASNEERTSKIILSAARFSIFDPFVAMQHGRQKKVTIRVSSPLISPETIPNKLRNPSFQKMNDAIKSFKNAKGQIQNEKGQIQNEKGQIKNDKGQIQNENGQIKNEINIYNSDDVLSLIDEIFEAYNEMAKYKDLIGFLRQTIIPYAEKWQKRTFKIISASNESSSHFTECFNKTKTLLSIFNMSIIATIEKTDSKINKLNDILFENIVEFAANNQKLNSEVVNETSLVWISMLKYISIAEVIILTVFFYFYSSRKQKF